MKRKSACLFLMVMIISVFSSSLSDVEACFNPTDSFATEVLLNKQEVSYDLTPLMDLEGVEVVDDVVIYRSHFNRDVAVVLTVVDEQHGSLKGLSVKIQIPVKEDLIKTAYVMAEGLVDKGMSELDVYAAEALGWNVKGVSELATTIFKDNIVIQVEERTKRESENISRYETSVQIRVSNAETLSGDVRREIEEALSAIGLDNLDFILRDENITVGYEEYTDLVPSVDVDPETLDWREVMKTELEWLVKNGLVSGLTDQDIQDISSACERGTAGHNSRIVYEESWMPYNETDNPLLLRDWDCGGFSAQSLPESDLGDLKKISDTTSLTYLSAAIAIIASILAFLLYLLRKA